VGAIVSRRTGHAWAWQIEHNGGWHWQVGECTHRSPGHGPGPEGRHAPQGAVSGAYLALLGPADSEHHWRITLGPGEAFTTVPTSVAVSRAGFDGAIGGLTAIRRAIRRPHEDARRLPVIFNDYMNTLMADPTTERLLPLIAAAAEAGAEYFCIDAGWYAEIDESWWDTVGAWRPSQTRFPGGLAEVLGRITEAGMVPGLWLEPEVVGVNSEVVRELPTDAFFQRDGQLIVEHGRYHLDLRHPAAVKHLDKVVDFLVAELGVGYLKLDYNIAVAVGPDTGGLSAGAGLLAANRAQLDWLDAVLDRYPALVIENCSSGGMRTDYALLSRTQLQSTSDQQEYLRYPPIAAAAPAAIAPEQAAVWAYPQPEQAAGEIAFTMVNAMLGRVHLSGHLNRMNVEQGELVAEAVRVYKESIRPAIAKSVPFWPLGLPRWDDPWVALGLRAPGSTQLAVWRRGPAEAAQLAVETMPVPHVRGLPAVPHVLYPRHQGAEASWDAVHGMLTVSLPDSPSACVLRIDTP
jgi:alpha-galactosidase